MLEDYRNNREAREWIEANQDNLGSFSTQEAITDPVDIASYQLLTPERIANAGREFEFGLFVNPEQENQEEKYSREAA